MTQLRPVDRWEWLDLIRRARLGRTTKAVAVMLASYANEDGSRVFPGIARLAVVCEIGYNTAKTCLAELRAKGWIERVAHAGARGRADVYQLTVRDGEDVPSPALIEMEIERLRKEKGGRGKGRQPGARADVPEQRQPTARADVVDNAVDADGRQPTARADVPSTPEPTSAHGTGRPEPTSARLTNDVGPRRVPPHEQVHEPLTPTNHDDDSIADAGTSAREGAAEDPISDEEKTRRPILRLVEALSDTPEEPRSATKTGNGFCLPCYRSGQVTVAVDPIRGSACAHHLAAQEAS